MYQTPGQGPECFHHPWCHGHVNTFPLTKLKKGSCRSGYFNIFFFFLMFALERLTMKNAIQTIKLSDKKQDLDLLNLASVSALLSKS